LDGDIELVCGAFSSDKERSKHLVYPFIFKKTAVIAPIVRCLRKKLYYL